ncbi:type II toxin-antitoxin system YafO family toxin [Xenorhabdus sp. XENO-10]|uniref:Type II toxin-antitoxin system YafO family toxin n=2 Tax=Xenorhabdus yunnanensis TaxID=3025878 RepID=A0ABT5LGA6_9GAMM|nr:type II toxin-antitoxin system YafO family toxin [Xenorhabdus yunnanensis]
MLVVARKSNSYLFYTRHWCEPEKYQFISIMTPNAHEFARMSFLSVLVDRVPKIFRIAECCRLCCFFQPEFYVIGK